MIDHSKKINPALSESDRNQLINRIDELENLLAKKKASTRQARSSALKFDSNGIPVLMETVSDDETDAGLDESIAQLEKRDEVINEIIKKVDQEISQDLDELLVMLKNSIVDEVRTRILNELQDKQHRTGKKQE